MGLSNLGKNARHSAVPAAVIFLLLAVVASAAIEPATWAWIVTLVMFIAFTMAVGVAIQGRPDGILIDSRNRISLSKFQAVAWSLIVLSAFFTAAIYRIGMGFTDALDMKLPGELLAAMGIAATSLAATPVVLSLKTTETANPEKVEETADKLGDDAKDVVPRGAVYARRYARDAEWMDMFRGEEVSNAATPDLSKLQQFLITAVVLIAYGASLWQGFAAPKFLTDESTAPAWFSAFPPLSETMVWLIGISHAGYLAYKAVPRTAANTGSPETPAATSVATTPSDDGSVG